jgi:sporulation-control protein
VVFQKITSLFGANVTIDTVLHDTNVTPGGQLHGEVRFAGVEHAHHVQSLSLGLTAVIDSSGQARDHEFQRSDIGVEFALEAGVQQNIPFVIDVPWETPVSSLVGRTLPGMRLGVVTQLALRNAFDSGDLDPLVVEPLPVHLRVLSALDTLGFIFHRAELRTGSLPGSRMPFFQEIEYWAAGEYGMAFKALDLTFITSQAVTLVVIEMDRSAGLPDLGGDRCFSLTVSNTDTADLLPPLREQLLHLVDRVV